MSLNNELTIRRTLVEKIEGLQAQIDSLELKNRLLAQRLARYEPPPEPLFEIRSKPILINPQG